MKDEPVILIWEGSLLKVTEGEVFTKNKSLWVSDVQISHLKAAALALSSADQHIRCVANESSRITFSGKQPG